MSKITFAIVGNGWRAEFYIRIAKFYHNKYEIKGVLCRSSEKAEKIQKEYGIYATTNEQDIINSKPDFVVVSVSKPVIASVTEHWRKLGFTVLCETSVGVTVEELINTYNAPNEYGKLMVAEQYRYYPSYKKIIDCVKEGKLGDTVSAHVSLAHEYHGVSLIRAFLEEPSSRGFRLMAHSYELPVSKTGDRFEFYYDGEIIYKNKTVATIEFDDGKVAIYDFESEQYHSLIRHNSVKVTGTRGQIIDEKIWYLDSENRPVKEMLFDDLQHAQKGQFANLSEDETAIESMLENVYKVSRNDPDAIRWQEENLKNALTDAYFTILLKKSNGEWVKAETMPWQE